MGVKAGDKVTFTTRHKLGTKVPHGTVAKVVGAQAHVQHDDEKVKRLTFIPVQKLTVKA